MPRFKYKAQLESGEIERGTAEAEDRFALARKLREQGKNVISARGHTPSRSLWKRLNNLFVRVELQDKTVFVRNLGAMVGAGLPLSRALKILGRQTRNARMQKIVADLRTDIEQGGSLSGALEKHDDVFSPLFIAMAKAGEETGGLPDAFDTIATHLKQSYELRSRVRGALIYPAIIVVAMGVIGILMMLFVVPTLTETFESLGVTLPFTTQLILTTSTILKDYTLFFSIALLAMVAGGWYALRTRTGTRVFEWSILHTPVIGELVKKVNAARTARTLASLLSSGVPMVEAIAITRDVVQNSYYQDVLREAGERVQRGVSLSEVLGEHEDIYPILVGEMTAVGEETGKLSELLEELAIFYESEVERSTKNLSKIIEPVLMIIIGAAVGFFAFSMITPMYSVLGGI